MQENVESTKSMNFGRHASFDSSITSCWDNDPLSSQISSFDNTNLDLISGETNRENLNNNFLDNYRDVAKDRNVPVSVSGELYLIPVDIFRRLERLPWKWSGDADIIKLMGPRTNVDTECCYYLHFSPYLFEIILNYISQNTLPTLKHLNTADSEELAIMAEVLELRKLHRYFKENKQTKFRTLRQGQSLYLNRNQQKSLDQMKKGKEKKYHNLKRYFTTNSLVDDNNNMNILSNTNHLSYCEATKSTKNNKAKIASLQVGPLSMIRSTFRR